MVCDVIIVIIVLNCFHSRHSVTVMPRADAASIVCSLCHLALFVYSVCRVGARHDGYREPRL